MFEAAAVGDCDGDGASLDAGDALISGAALEATAAGAAVPAGTAVGLGVALGAGEGVGGVGPRTSTRTSVAETSLHAFWVKKYRTAEPGVRSAKLGFHFSSRVKS